MQKGNCIALCFSQTYLETDPASNVAKDAKGLGLGRKGGITTLPPLQHLL